MSDKRPCSVCKRWFAKDPRVGDRHRTCDRHECQTVAGRRASAKWRRENPESVIAGRLRRKLPKSPPDPPEVAVLDPMRHFSPTVVRHVMGVKESVLLEEVAKVLVSIARHEMPPKIKVKGSVARKVLQSAARHETDAARAPP